MTRIRLKKCCKGMAGDAKHAAQRRTFVHHQQHISQSGDDSEWNLITLGAACHKNVHRGA
jgi:hypothetical protein